jgi:ribosomal protein S18 acetylase RimI-like enzyme
MSVTTVNLHEINRIDNPALEQLSDLLVRVVATGAAVSFLHPLPFAEARHYWTGVLRPGVFLVTASANQPSDRPGSSRVNPPLTQRIIGTVQVHLAGQPNGKHRADIAKMMVDPDWQRRGVGRALLDRAEAIALREGRTTLILDTEAGAPSNRLYLSAGWREVGRIPEYARSSSGGLHSTVYYAKWLSPDGSVREPTS